MSLDVSILGPVTATFDGRPIPLGDKRPRVFFAILAHDLKVVEKKRLIRCLWDSDDQPADPDDALQTCAKEVRAALSGLPGGRDLLRTVRGTGYQLMIKSAQVDRHRFDALRLRAEAAERDSPGAAARLGRRALREWPSSTGLRGGAPLESDETRMDEFTQPLRMQHRELRLLCIRAELACGRHRELLPELARLEAEEFGAADADLVRLYMLALFRAGLSHEAATVFERYEQALGEIGGFRTVQEIKDLRNRILNDDEALKLSEVDYADYDPPESPAEEEAEKEVHTPSGGSAFSSIQLGEKARNYQAHSMVFHEKSDEE